MQLGLEQDMMVVPHDGIGSLIGRGRETIPPLCLCHWGHSKNAVTCKPRRELSWETELAKTQTLNFLRPTSVGKYISVVCHPVYGILLWPFNLIQISVKNGDEKDDDNDRQNVDLHHLLDIALDGLHA